LSESHFPFFYATLGF